MKSSPADIGGWLAGLGLEQYAAAFRTHHVDARILPKLTAEDLKDIGVGEAGIGKSRLIAELVSRVRDEVHTRLNYFCSPHHTDSAFHPVIAQLERAAGLARGDAPETKREKLRTLLVPSTSAEDLALLAELLSIPAERPPAGGDLTPQRKRQELIRALLRQLELLTAELPVLMIFEDLHWCDPSTLELLDRTVAMAADRSLLLIAAFRPEFGAPWFDLPHMTAVPLIRLDEREGSALVRRVGGRSLACEIVAEIVERTDGIPLFIEELTAAILEAGDLGGMEKLAAVPRPGLGVPAALQAPLMSRLDLLGTAAKETAQIGAAIGREFSHELLANVAERPGEQADRALAQLLGANLLSRRGAPPRAVYWFKHALVRDLAYASLLRGQRRHIHGRIAEAMERSFPEVAQAQPELIALHWCEAGEPARAIAYWLRAASLALGRSGVKETLAQLGKAEDELRKISDGPEKDRMELELQLALGGAYIAARDTLLPRRAGRSPARGRCAIAWATPRVSCPFCTANT